MYLRNLSIRNIKLLRDVNISFTRDGEVRTWTVLVGENGLCKTALLQAIALAASGITLASELADVLSLPDRRLPDKSTSAIAATFDFGPSGHAHRTYPGHQKRGNPPGLRSVLKTQAGWREFEGGSSYKAGEVIFDVGQDFKLKHFDPLREARREQLPAWFIAGYGPMRSLAAIASVGSADTRTARPEAPLHGALA